jgi:hypothetical protein
MKNVRKGGIHRIFEFLWPDSGPDPLHASLRKSALEVGHKHLMCTKIMPSRRSFHCNSVYYSEILSSVCL